MLEDLCVRAIDRIKQRVPQLRGMVYLDADTDIPILLPEEWHEIISIFIQKDALEFDDRYYDAKIANNEFEQRLDSLKGLIASGELIITDSEGNEVLVSFTPERVSNVYFKDVVYDTTADGRYTDPRPEYDSSSDGETVPG